MSATSRKERRRALETLWRKHAGGSGAAALDEASVCGAVELLASLYDRGGGLPAWGRAVVARVPGVVRQMEGRSVAQARLPPPPPPLRTNRTRRVPHPVLIEHAASLTPY
jgi:hypothetical protein